MKIEIGDRVQAINTDTGKPMQRFGTIVLLDEKMQIEWDCGRYVIHDPVEICEFVKVEAQS